MKMLTMDCDIQQMVTSRDGYLIEQNGMQGSTLRKNFISLAGLVTIAFTSPEILLLALKIDDMNTQYFFSC